MEEKGRGRGRKEGREVEVKGEDGIIILSAATADMPTAFLVIN